MKPEELAAIRARADAATRGPWEWQSAWDGQFFWLSGAEDRSVLAAVLDDGSAGGEYEQTIAPDSADGLFVAHARADVPAILAEIERLRSLLDAVTVPPAPVVFRVDEFPPYHWDGHQEDFICAWCGAHKYEPQDEPHDAECAWAAARKALGQ